MYLLEKLQLLYFLPDFEVSGPPRPVVLPVPSEVIVSPSALSPEKEDVELHKDFH